MMHLIPRMQGEGGRHKTDEVKDTQWVESEAKTLAEYFREK